MTPTLIYVYCLVRSARRPAVASTLDAAGVPGGRDTRAVAVDGAGAGRLWMIAATVPAGDYGEAALAAGLQDLDWVGPRAVGHEAVIEHFLQARAVLPMQLFTLFRSDERALAHVARDRRAIERILDRVERKQEWGLRLTFDETAARAAVETAQGRATRRGARPAVSGTAYLTRKRDLLDVTRVQLTQARGDADRLYGTMARLAADARRRTATETATPGSRLLLDAAFLVPSARTRGFRAALAREARRLTTTGIVVSLTGPWPPYNFIASPERPRRGAKKA